MLKAIFFDLDGTLINSEIIWVEATWQALIHHYSLSVSYEEIKEIVFGRAWNDIFNHLQTLFPQQLISLTETEKIVEQEFRKLTQKGIPPIIGSVNALKRLAKQGKTIAIVSGSPRKMIQEAIDFLGIHDEVLFYLGSEDYSPGKPSPACFIKAQQKSGFAAEHCLVIEDSAAGLRSAKKAAIRSIAIEHPETPQDLSDATYTTQNLETFDFNQL